ncbi:MAG: germination protein YpeB [Ruminococcus sp.]|nr:germination protein YpeB [Ruminococcus sp.]
MTVSKRFAVRAIAFTAAVVAVLGVKAGMYHHRAVESEESLKYSYLSAIEGLSQSADSINSVLEKELYAGSPLMHAKLSAQLLTYAESAKATLTRLPIESMGLANTCKFLSQVGSFSQAMSEKLSKGEKLTKAEYENLNRLHEYSDSLSDMLWELNDRVSTGQTLTLPDDEQKNTELIGDSEGIKDYENSFENYPKLIYDGPFSDNILDKESALLKTLKEVDEDTAKQKCIMALGINSKDIPNTAYVYGKIPSYRFYDDDGNVSCAVTKQGGLVSYFIKTRRVNSADITAEQAVDFAGKFLDSLGITDMESTYYEVYDNVCTVNFACVRAGIIMYTDLIKVQVAMSDGGIVGYDARGYIVNHREREKGDGVISAKRAAEEISPVLKQGAHRLCFIPTQGGREVLCHEFECLSDTGRKVLVYINARTAAEEQILLISESASGVLTV